MSHPGYQRTSSTNLISGNLPHLPHDGKFGIVTGGSRGKQTNAHSVYKAILLRTQQELVLPLLRISLLKAAHCCWYTLPIRRKNQPGRYVTPCQSNILFAAYPFRPTCLNPLVALRTSYRLRKTTFLIPRLGAFRLIFSSTTPVLQATQC